MNTVKETTTKRKKNGQQKELFGETFKIVKNGLDEKEIVSFLNGLIEAKNEADRNRLQVLQKAKDMACAIIAEANEATEKSAATKASAEEEANRIKAEVSQKTKELPIEIRATAQKETQNARDTKRDLKRHYKQIYEELVANLDSITEITDTSTRGVSVTVTLQGVKLPQLHARPVIERAKAILLLFCFSFILALYLLPQCLLKLFNLLARWLKNGYLLVRWMLQPEIRRVRKVASQLAEAILLLFYFCFILSLYLLPQYLSKLFNPLVRWLKNGYLLVRWMLQPEIRRVRKVASQLKERLYRIRQTN